MKVFVAGATGVVGSRTVTLLLAAGHEVTGLARSAEKAGLLASQGARPVQASLFDPGALGRAVAGHDAVVNLATHIPVGAAAIRPRAWREDDRIRTEGSRILVDAALRHEVARLVQEAVTFVYPDRGDEWITEETAPEPNRRFQAATMAATAQAARFTAGGGSGVVLRFGQFYGPDRASAEMLARARAWQAGRSRQARRLAVPAAPRGRGRSRDGGPGLRAGNLQRGRAPGAALGVGGGHQGGSRDRAGQVLPGPAAKARRPAGRAAHPVAAR